MLKYEKLILGELQTNCYLVWNESDKQCLIIDPADDGVSISEEIQVKGLKPMGILATHGHFDHTLGVLDLKLIYDVPFYCSSKDMFLLERQQSTATHFLKKKIVVPNIIKIDVDLDNINIIDLGDEKLEVIKTPGHTPGSVCFLNPPAFQATSLKKGGFLFSGDTLFKGSRGRTDFSYGSTKKIFESLKKLMKLPKDTVVLSGHGEETTIGKESSRFL